MIICQVHNILRIHRQTLKEVFVFYSYRSAKASDDLRLSTGQLRLFLKSLGVAQCMNSIDVVFKAAQKERGPKLRSNTPRTRVQSEPSTGLSLKQFVEVCCSMHFASAFCV